MKRSLHKSRLSNAIQALIRSISGPQAVSVRMAAVVLLVLSIGTAFTDLKQDPSQQILWAGIAFQAFLMSFVLFILLARLVNWAAPRRGFTRFCCLLAVYALVEISRAVFVGTTAENLGLSPEMYWAYRIVAGGLTGMTLFSLGSIIANDSSAYRQDMQNLLETQKQLEAAVSTTEEDIIAQRGRLLNEINAAVSHAIFSVLDRASENRASLSQVVKQLIEVSQEVVRPLSHQLLNQSLVGEQSLPSESKKVKFRRVLYFTTLTRPFQPAVFASIAFLLVIGAALFAMGEPVTGLFGLFMVLIWVWGILALLNRFVQPYLERWSLPTRILVITGAWILLTIFPLAVIFIAGNLQLGRDYPFVLYSLSLGQILGWLLAIYPGLQAARQEVSSQLIETNADLEWANARLGTKLWSEKTTVAQTLHRDIQGALVASAMRLQRSIDQGKDGAVVLNQLRDELEKVVVTVAETPAVNDLKVGLDEISNNWQGVFQLTTSSDEEASRRLDNDELARRLLFDLVSEFITNSIKHGQSARGTAEMQMLSQSTIILRLQNDGKKLTLPVTPGLGTQMAQAQCIEAFFRNLPADSGVEFTAVIAVE